MKTKFSHHLLCALSKVHYLSLDIEGGEMSVLRTIPWHNVDIWLLSVEVALLSCEAWALITIWNLFNVDQKTFGNVSIQQLSFRSTIFVPSPDKPRCYAQPRSPVEQVEIGTHEEQSLFFAHFLTKLRQELVEFMESQGYRWIGTAGF